MNFKPKRFTRNGDYAFIMRVYSNIKYFQLLNHTSTIFFFFLLDKSFSDLIKSINDKKVVQILHLSLFFCSNKRKSCLIKFHKCPIKILEVGDLEVIKFCHSVLILPLIIYWLIGAKNYLF